MTTGLIIAIDGPAGAGKSSTSRLLAERLGYRYVDTGALYRAVGLLAWEQGIQPSDSLGLAALCVSLALRFEPHPAGQRLFIGGRDVTTEIRRPEVGQMASKVSARPVVREHLLTLQRDLGKDGSAVLEGRDIGTVVFPDADLKVYLDASAEERSLRRYAELEQKGTATSLKATHEDMQERDKRDSGRAHAPLRAAADAIILDTTSLSLAEVVDALVKRVEIYASRGERAASGASGDAKRGK